MTSDGISAMSYWNFRCVARALSCCLQALGRRQHEVKRRGTRRRLKDCTRAFLTDMHVCKIAFDMCPMAELVTASDCYIRRSEGREFEPHWGSSIVIFVCLVIILSHVAILRLSELPGDQTIGRKSHS